MSSVSLPYSDVLKLILTLLLSYDIVSISFSKWDSEWQLNAAASDVEGHRSEIFAAAVLKVSRHL